MPTRRRFLRSLFAAGATLPALRNDALSRILPTLRGVDGRSAADVAQDEDFWREIQAAFDIDRGMINLNNGGVAPSPRVVYAALQRYLAISNQAPAITMWAWIEPEIETVRRRLAGNFGCDPEEMAITRNASEALRPRRRTTSRAALKRRSRHAPRSSTSATSPISRARSFR